MDGTPSEKSTPGGIPSRNPVWRVFSLRDFRLLFGGTATSILGDQFYLIATPWLVLQLTNDPLALGVIIALGGIPRAVFMLLGGAVTDRFSPRLIMIASDILRMALTAWMALAVATGSVQVWMLYAVSLGFGFVAGFAIPAGNSIVPMLVEERDLQAGNSVILGTTQLAGFVGPTLAGLLIGGSSNSSVGIGLAYGVDAVTFAVSAAALLLMRSGGNRTHPDPSAAQGGILGSIVAGMKFLWNDRALRLMFVVVMAVNLLFIGPVLVGVPVLANDYLPEGAVAFGLLVSGLAGGNLGGYLLAAQLRRPRGNFLRNFLLAGLAAFGLALAMLGFIRSTPVLLVLVFLLGLGNGYITILVLTWIQSRTPKDMLGRMMSMLMLTNTGVSPISQAISGAVLRWSLPVLFFAAGSGLILVPLWTAAQPALDQVADGLAEDPRKADRTQGDGR
jgi:MFS family permease